MTISTTNYPKEIEKAVKEGLKEEEDIELNSKELRATKKLTWGRRIKREKKFWLCLKLIKGNSVLEPLMEHSMIQV